MPAEIGLPVQPSFRILRIGSACDEASPLRELGARVVLGLLSTAGLEGAGSPLGGWARRERQRREVEAKKSKEGLTNDDFPNAAPAPWKRPTRAPLRSPDSQERSQRSTKRNWRNSGGGGLRKPVRACAKLNKTPGKLRIKTVFVGGGGISGMSSGAARSRADASAGFVGNR